MALVSLLCLIVMFVLVGVGIALGALAGLLTLGLVGAGVVSSSVAVGIWRGKAQVGIRAFLVQCGILAGIPAGMLCAWLATQALAHAEAGLVGVLAIGAASGAASGVVVALLLDFIAQRVRLWLAVHTGRS